MDEPGPVSGVPGVPSQPTSGPARSRVQPTTRRVTRMTASRGDRVTVCLRRVALLDDDDPLAAPRREAEQRPAEALGARAVAPERHRALPPRVAQPTLRAGLRRQLDEPDAPALDARRDDERTAHA